MHEGDSPVGLFDQVDFDPTFGAYKGQLNCPCHLVLKISRITSKKPSGMIPMFLHDAGTPFQFPS